MNKDTLEGNVRSAVGQGEKMLGPGDERSGDGGTRRITTTPPGKRGRPSEAQKTRSAGRRCNFLARFLRLAR